MAKFITIGYGDGVGNERTSVELRDAAHACDAWPVERGAIVGIAGTPIQMRNHANGGVRTARGAFSRSDRSVAGFALVEEEKEEEAVQPVAQTPCVIAYGEVDVWPLATPPEAR